MSHRSSHLVILAIAGLVVWGCSDGGAGVQPRPGDDPAGDDDDAVGFDPYYCCDPDEICECEGLWHCTETDDGKRCTQESPNLPDDGGTGAWECSYRADLIVCRGEADEHPDAGGDGEWTCTGEEAGWIECTQESDEGDYPEGGGESEWDCAFLPGNDLRTCNETDAGEGEGEGEEGEGEEGEGEDCADRESCEDGVDNDCNGLVDCVDPACSCAGGDEVCDGQDNDGDGRIDEGRACGDANEGDGPCPVGAFRICDAYCGVHQVCGPDGEWGPCLVDEDCSQPRQCDQHSDCPRGNYCDYGECVPGTFDFFPCESDEDCGDEFGGGFGDASCQVDQGVCITDCYHHSDCGAGLVCDLGMCVEDPYMPGQCG